MIGIVVPTRGLVFSRTIEAIEREREGKETKLYISNNLPIPQGHNDLTKQALLDGADYIWYVEEDTVPPSGSLDGLLAQSTDIACIDYGVSGWGCVTKNLQEKILWCGLGCTLVKSTVLEAIGYPYFRVDKSLRLNDWKWITLPKGYIETRNYGTLDIRFGCDARKLGFEIREAPGECEHLELKELGKREVNRGLHKIEIRPRILNRQIINNDLERG